MTAKEKAEKLVSDFYSINCKLVKVNNGYDMGNRYNLVFPKSKQCALILVDEILDLNLGLSNCDENNWSIDEFYNEVKQEIEKL